VTVPDHYFLLIGLRLCCFSEGAALALARCLHPAMFTSRVPGN